MFWGIVGFLLLLCGLCLVFGPAGILILIGGALVWGWVDHVKNDDKAW